MIRTTTRYLALVLALCCLLPLCTSCTKPEQSDKIEVLCTVFPLYDWVRNIVGDSETVEVSLLITNGSSDLHSYQPSAKDMVAISSADLFFYVGGVSDAWVEDALRTHDSEDRIDVKMTEIPEIRLREICSDSTEEHDDHEHGAIDEHLWLSLINAKTASSYLCDRLCELDEQGAEQYRENYAAYAASLDALDEEYSSLVASVDDPMILCADRFPFVYLAEDYGIRYVAAFEGCSTDANATPDTILRLAQAVDEHGVRAILVTERHDGQLAESVLSAARSKDVEILCLVSMQSTTMEMVEAGDSYIQLMKANLDTLRKVWGL
ncbi:MAG: zinc ABC transporter substrate-binding protein [Clostridia bacterium]|nr:zinc ABC transporter substrate-binding protein [Clostridia bacterium]